MDGQIIVTLCTALKQVPECYVSAIVMCGRGQGGGLTVLACCTLGLHSNTVRVTI